MKTVKVECQDCGREVSVPEAEWQKNLDKKEKYTDSIPCKVCGGALEEVDEQEDEEESEEEQEESEENCIRCKIKLKEDEDYYQCDECDDEPICKKCIVPLENLTVCKKCVDKLYPRNSETKIEYRDKIIEKPIIRYINKESNEEIFDNQRGNSSLILDSIF